MRVKQLITPMHFRGKAKLLFLSPFSREITQMEHINAVDALFISSIKHEYSLLTVKSKTYQQKIDHKKCEKHFSILAYALT